MTFSPTALSSVHEDGSIDRLAIDTIRTLAMDAVQKANSGHPGTPMALAPVGYTLWRDHLRYDPDHARLAQPRPLRAVGRPCLDAALLRCCIWPASRRSTRDGKKTGKPAVSLDDIKQFRQLGSKTPGHPEYRMTTGVETTTGPLGQGCANSVGMAIAERGLAAHFNRDGFTLFDYDVYVFCGDGDMMEGVASEAARSPGTWSCPTSAGSTTATTSPSRASTDLAFTEDVGKRFEGYGWNVIHLDDANDTAAFAEAIEAFKATTDRPTFIVVHSSSATAARSRARSKAHSDAHGRGRDPGRPRRPTAGRRTRSSWCPTASRASLGEPMRQRGGALRDAVGGDVRALQGRAIPELGRGTRAACAQGKLPDGLGRGHPDLPRRRQGHRHARVGRQGAERHRAALARADRRRGRPRALDQDHADLRRRGRVRAGRATAAATCTSACASTPWARSPTAWRCAICAPTPRTFLVFSDYMRPPIRLAAIMELPVIFVFTHDSIGVGEDGPTHQPIEQLAALRAIPGLDTIRPGDANEAAQAWKVGADATRTSRRPWSSRARRSPTLDRTKYASAEGLQKGGYVLADCEGEPEVILIGTGSELPMVVAAHEKLTAEGVRSRVVSLPSWYLFEKQDQAYRDSRAAAERRGAAGGGAGRRARLGPLCRPEGRDHHHVHLRRLRAPGQAAGEVRLHASTTSARRPAA